jgi:hypothetical protein
LRCVAKESNVKQFALMFVLAGCVGVGCNPVKAADPEPIAVKPPTKSVEAAPANLPAAMPAAAPAAVPAAAAAVEPVLAAAVEPAADAKAVPKRAASSSQPKGKTALSSDLPRRPSKKGGGVTSF